jgi:uncharacterized repeat protein (TIGR04138 family)
MRHEVEFLKTIERICAEDDRFAPGIYVFVMEAVDFTIQWIGERRHVSAAELLAGLSRYARERFGLLAHEVLEGWGVQSPADIGRVVYDLVGAGYLSKQHSDRFEDFEHGFDLRGALEDGYFE